MSNQQPLASVQALPPPQFPSVSLGPAPTGASSAPLSESQQSLTSSHLGFGLPDQHQYAVGNQLYAPVPGSAPAGSGGAGWSPNNNIIPALSPLVAAPSYPTPHSFAYMTANGVASHHGSNRQIPLPSHYPTYRLHPDHQPYLSHQNYFPPPPSYLPQAPVPYPSDSSFRVPQDTAQFAPTAPAHAANAHVAACPGGTSSGGPPAVVNASDSESLPPLGHAPVHSPTYPPGLPLPTAAANQPRSRSHGVEFADVLRSGTGLPSLGARSGGGGGPPAYALPTGSTSSSQPRPPVDPHGGGVAPTPTEGYREQSSSSALPRASGSSRTVSAAGARSAPSSQNSEAVPAMVATLRAPAIQVIEKTDKNKKGKRKQASGQDLVMTSLPRKISCILVDFMPDLDELSIKAAVSTKYLKDHKFEVNRPRGQTYKFGADDTYKLFLSFAKSLLTLCVEKNIKVRGLGESREPIFVPLTRSPGSGSGDHAFVRMADTDDPEIWSFESLETGAVPNIGASKTSTVVFMLTREFSERLNEEPFTRISRTLFTTELERRRQREEAVEAGIRKKNEMRVLKRSRLDDEDEESEQALSTRQRTQAHYSREMFESTSASGADSPEVHRPLEGGAFLQSLRQTAQGSTPAAFSIEELVNDVAVAPPAFTSSSASIDPGQGFTPAFDNAATRVAASLAAFEPTLTGEESRTSIAEYAAAGYDYIRSLKDAGLYTESNTIYVKNRASLPIELDVETRERYLANSELDPAIESLSLGSQLARMAKKDVRTLVEQPFFAGVASTDAKGVSRAVSVQTCRRGLGDLTSEVAQSNYRAYGSEHCPVFGALNFGQHPRYEAAFHAGIFTSWNLYHQQALSSHFPWTDIQLALTPDLAKDLNFVKGCLDRFASNMPSGLKVVLDVVRGRRYRGENLFENHAFSTWYTGLDPSEAMMYPFELEYAPDPSCTLPGDLDRFLLDFFRAYFGIDSRRHARKRFAEGFFLLPIQYLLAGNDVATFTSTVTANLPSAESMQAFSSFRAHLQGLLRRGDSHPVLALSSPAFHSGMDDLELDEFIRTKLVLQSFVSSATHTAATASESAHSWNFFKRALRDVPSFRRVIFDMFLGSFERVRFENPVEIRFLAPSPSDNPEFVEFVSRTCSDEIGLPAARADQSYDDWVRMIEEALRQGSTLSQWTTEEHNRDLSRAPSIQPSSTSTTTACTTTATSASSPAASSSDAGGSRGAVQGLAATREQATAAADLRCTSSGRPSTSRYATANSQPTR